MTPKGISVPSPIHLLSIESIVNWNLYIKFRHIFEPSAMWPGARRMSV